MLAWFQFWSIRDQSLALMLQGGSSVDTTLFHLDNLNRSGLKFKTFPALIPAVHDAQEKLAAVRRQLAQRLSQPSSTVFRRSGGGEVGEQLVERVMIKSGAGVETARYLETAEKQGVQFDAAEDMIAYIRTAHGKWQDGELKQRDAPSSGASGGLGSGAGSGRGAGDRDGPSARSPREAGQGSGSGGYESKGEGGSSGGGGGSSVELLQERRNALLAYFRSSGCTLFASDAGALQVTDDELDALCADREPSAFVLMLLRWLDEKGNKYSTFRALINAVREQRNSSVALKKAILEYVRAPDHRLLPTTACGKLSAGDIDRLFVESAAAADTLTHLKDLSAAGKQFDSFGALVLAVKSVHALAVETRFSEKLLLHAFLTSPACKLFYDPVEPSDAELLQLLEAARTGPSALAYMLQLDAIGRRYESAQDLVRRARSLLPLPSSAYGFALPGLHVAHASCCVPRCVVRSCLRFSAAPATWTRARATLWTT